MLAVANMMRDIGVETKIEGMDNSAKSSKARAFEFDNHLDLRQTSSDLFTNVFIYASQYGRTPGSFIIPRLNELHLAARATMDQAEHTKIFRKIGEIMVEQNQSIPLLWIPTVMIYNPDVVSKWRFPGSLINLFSHFENIQAAR